MKRTSIFIVPRASTAWKGNEAGWITASGWASAGQQLWGEALVATTDGIFSPQESILFPRTLGGASTSRSKKKPFRKLVPEFLITGYKDWKLKNSKPHTWPIEQDTRLNDRQVMMVWERHDLFPGPGRRLANKLRIPLVTSVEAAVVWEARKWGVTRPLWGQWLEKNVEAKSLKQSDLVSCVSEEVKEKVIAMGVDPNKVIVSPNRVDASVFHPGVDGSAIEKNYNLKNKKVLGWTGSFRSFHGLDTLVSAFKQVHIRHPDALMILVGDGLEFEKIKQLASDNGLENLIIFPGKQPFTSIPSFVATFHVALVSARSAEGFHYSPLKLREYLAAGKAVIAPRAGNLPDLFLDGRDLSFYHAGDATDLAGKINQLLEDQNMHRLLTKNALALFESEGTWIHELKKVCERLNISY
jgi:glycosyltransferase involved in cell wall biosynthesis